MRKSIEINRVKTTTEGLTGSVLAMDGLHRMWFNLLVVMLVGIIVEEIKVPTRGISAIPFTGHPADSGVDSPTQAPASEFANYNQKIKTLGTKPRKGEAYSHVVN